MYREINDEQRICWITRFCSFFIRLGIMDTTDRRGPMSISWFSPSVHLVERSRILIDPFPVLSPLVTSFAFRERQLCRNFVISLCFPSLLLGWQFSFLAHIFKLFFWNFNDFRILLDPWRERKRERECDSHVRLFRNRREKETDRVSGFYSPSKADISSSLTVFLLLLLPLLPLVHRQGRHFFIFLLLPPFVISFYTWVDSHSTYRDEYIRWKRVVGHVQRILFASNLFVYRYRRRYILHYRGNLYAREGGLFTHIIFLPLYTFSSNYFFLVRNSVRWDDDDRCVCTFPPS